MQQRIWLARHGNRQDFVDPEWQKTAARPHDPDLSADGKEQARCLGNRLRRERISRILASPFLRTVHTAAIVADALDLSVFLEPGIAEWMNPEWFPQPPVMLHPSELKERFPRVNLAHAARGRPSYPETEPQALARAGETSRTLAASYDESLLLVGHGASVAGAVGGLVRDEEITECALCGLFGVRRTRGGWQLEIRDDVAHLDARVAADRFH